MESGISSSRIYLHSKSDQQSGGGASGARDGLGYLASFPGGVRVLSVILSFLSLILVLLGFPDEYEYSEDIDGPVYYPDRYERRRKPWLRLTPDGRFVSFESYYGAGYSNERANAIQLGCIVTCLAVSGFFLFILVISARCHNGDKGRGWNRYLNLAMAITQFVGFFNGLLGLLLFRSYCCHVDFLGTERHRSELEGYFREPCLCYIKPGQLMADRDPFSIPVNNEFEYTTRYFHDSPDDIVFESAIPHHFIPHAIGLVLMGFNIILYLIASVRI